MQRPEAADKFKLTAGSHPLTVRRKVVSLIHSGQGNLYAKYTITFTNSINFER